MADSIYIKSGEFSSKSLRKVEKSIAIAQKKLSGLTSRGALENTFYLGADGYSHAIFSSSITGQVSDAARTLDDLAETLESYASILDTGPDKLLEIDADRKNELTDWWGRTTYSIGSGISAAGAGVVGFFSSIFSRSGAKGANTNGKTPLPERLSPHSAVSDAPDYENQEPCIEQKKAEKKDIKINDFSLGVERGTIRYIDQNGGYYSDLADGGWGSEAWKAEGECVTACESMCMSYLGIDATPERILTSREEVSWGSSDYVLGLENEHVKQHGSGWSYDEIGTWIDDFMNDDGQGNVSPVVVRYSDNHVVMILDKTENDDGSWTCTVLGPSNYRDVSEHDKVTVRIDIDGTITAISGKLANIESGSSKIQQCMQYSRTDTDI